MKCTRIVVLWGQCVGCLVAGGNGECRVVDSLQMHVRCIVTVLIQNALFTLQDIWNIYTLFIQVDYLSLRSCKFHSSCEASTWTSVAQNKSRMPHKQPRRTHTHTHTKSLFENRILFVEQDTFIYLFLERKIYSNSRCKVRWFCCLKFNAIHCFVRSLSLWPNMFFILAFVTWFTFAVPFMHAISKSHFSACSRTSVQCHTFCYLLSASSQMILQPLAT